ncbi:MAG TPA: hypothetical protein VFX97_16755 [Pyrinomonadaceae bacterium]|nr:hypothetical protein [Pyrinomonadaceae bacterium]
MLVLFQPVDWSAVGKTWGPLGIIFVAALILLFGIARFLKTYLERKDADAAKLVADAIIDARSERDVTRLLIKEQAAEFVAHIKEENQQFRDSLKDVVAAFERESTRRKR